MNIIKQHKVMGGTLKFCSHESKQTKTAMNFSVFTPETKAKLRGSVIWLSGLTCNEENFVMKAGAFKTLTTLGLQVFCPDTSPRGLKLPQEHDSWDFGAGAGFYVDSTTEGYRDHYRMYSYIQDEFYTLIRREFSGTERISIMGHSMGGHGALVIGLRNPEQFCSVSAFAPMVNPSQCPWGKRALLGYLGDDVKSWNAYDACELVKAGRSHPKEILIDQGSADQFLQDQLLPLRFVEACKGTKQKLSFRMQDGYDHSYYFISSFIGDHLSFHAEQM
jgi:S-formylglutathione hydrolase